MWSSLRHRPSNAVPTSLPYAEVTAAVRSAVLLSAGPFSAPAHSLKPVVSPRSAAPVALDARYTCSSRSDVSFARSVAAPVCDATAAVVWASPIVVVLVFLLASLLLEPLLLPHAAAARATSGTAVRMSALRCMVVLLCWFVGGELRCGAGERRVT